MARIAIAAWKSFLPRNIAAFSSACWPTKARYSIIARPVRTVPALLRRWEMPDVDPADYPDNPIVQYYAAKAKAGKLEAEPLYTPSGQSHLAQFFAYIDKQYGGSQGYLKQGLGFTDVDIAKLKRVMLR